MIVTAPGSVRTSVSSYGSVLGDRFRTARINADMSVDDVSARLGIPTTRIYHVESGSASLSAKEIYAAAALLGVAVEWLMN